MSAFCASRRVIKAHAVYSRWNAARSFASYLDAHPELYRDKSVLELGAGGGLPGLVAAKNGAKLVSKSIFNHTA